jgi:hypothetical protein
MYYTSFYVGGGAYAQIAGTNASDFSVSSSSSSGYSNMYSCGGVGISTCSIYLEFKPSAPGVRSARLNFNGGGYLPLTGNGFVGPHFVVTGSAALTQTVDRFGNVAATSTPLTLTNNGQTTYSFAASISGPNASLFSVDGSGCNTVAAGSNCTVTVTGNASAFGTYSASLLVADANSSYTVTVPVTETVSYAQLMESNTGSTSFPTQLIGTTSAPITFTVTDTASQPLGHAVTARLLYGTNFAISGPAICPASTSSPCTFNLVFQPTTGGSVFDSILFTDNVSGNETYAQVLGTGQATTQINISPGSLTFPLRTIGTTSVPMALTVTNTGTATLAVSSLSLSGVVNNNFSQTNNCTSVAVSGTCTINVTFAPTVTGPQSASVNIVSNATSSPDMVSVSGTAQ